MEVAGSNSLDEDARRRFEVARREDHAADLRDFLPSENDPRYLATLEELVHIDIELAWKSHVPERGTAPPLVEDYLARFPVLGSPDLLRRLLTSEFLARHRHGDKPATRDYRARFPEVVGREEEFLSALRRLEGSAGPPLVQGASLGRYQLLGEHARGGFGLVWLARDMALEREVALKQLNPDLVRDEGMRRRFVTEARIAAQLEHPGIVPVYEVLDAEGLRPAYVMKMVKGETLGQVIHRFHRQAGPDSARRVERIRLINAFLSVARAVAFVHSRGVIHRDLKPENILCGTYGETVILDWGLAKVLSRDRLEPGETGPAIQHAGSPALTRDGAVVGTPAYMAPEQAEGRLDEVDERSDVHGLGAILYELLTGKPPYSGRDSAEVLLCAATAKVIPPRTLRSDVPRALESICLKALALKKSDRYSGAEELVRDVERFLADEPVLAHRESWFDRGLRWLRRHRSAALAGSVALLLVAVVSVLAAFLIEAHRQEAVDAERKARAEQERAVAAEGMTREEQQRTAQALEHVEALLYHSNLTLASVEARRNPGPLAADLLDACPERLRNWEWHFARSLFAAGRLSIKAPGGQVLQVVFHPDGRRLAAIVRGTETGPAFPGDSPQRSGEAVLYDARQGAEIRRFTAPAAVLHLAFDSSGRHLFAVCLSSPAQRSSTVVAWDTETGRQQFEFQGHKGRVLHVNASADGRTVLGTGPQGSWLWNALDGTLLREGETGGKGEPFGCHAGFLSADGRSVLTCHGQSVSSWETAGGAPREVCGPHTPEWPGGSGAIRGIVCDREFKRLAAAGVDAAGTTCIHVWDLGNRRLLGTFTRASHHSECLAMGSDGDWLATGHADGLHIWSIRHGCEANRGLGHEGQTTCAAFSRDGKQLASGDDRGGILIRDMSAFPVRILGRAYASSMAMDPSGQRLVSGDLRMLRTDSGAEESGFRSHKPPQAPDCWVQFSPDGQLVAEVFRPYLNNAANSFPGPVLFNAPGEEETARYLNEGFPTGPAVVRIRDSGTGELRSERSLHRGSVRAFAFSPDGLLLATGSDDADIRLSTVRTSDPVALLKGHRAAVLALAFHPDGRTLFSSSADGSVRTWDVEHGTEQRIEDFGGAKGHVLACSRNGSRFAVGYDDGTVRVWDTASGKIAFLLRGHTRPVRALVFWPSGSRLATGGDDGTIRVWDMTSGQDVLTFAAVECEQRTPYAVQVLTCSPDGRTLYGLANGLILAWHAESFAPVSSKEISAPR